VNDVSVHQPVVQSFVHLSTDRIATPASDTGQSTVLTMSLTPIRAANIVPTAQTAGTRTVSCVKVSSSTPATAAYVAVRLSVTSFRSGCVIEDLAPSATWTVVVTWPKDSLRPNLGPAFLPHN
jgi:hypothetical protein